MLLIKIKILTNRLNLSYDFYLLSSIIIIITIQSASASIPLYVRTYIHFLNYILNEN